MTVDLIKLKALATAAATNQYDTVALNDYGTTVPPEGQKSARSESAEPNSQQREIQA